MIIKIKGLRLRTVLGIYEWEKEIKQDVILNLHIEFDGTKVGQSNDIDDTIDYKKLKQELMSFVEKNQFLLLEKMAVDILLFILKNDKILRATIEIDKLGALKYCDSVSVTETMDRASILL